jgi:hypothetical protein
MVRSPSFAGFFLIDPKVLFNYSTGLQDVSDLFTSSKEHTQSPTVNSYQEPFRKRLQNCKIFKFSAAPVLPWVVNFFFKLLQIQTMDNRQQRPG